MKSITFQKQENYIRLIRVLKAEILSSQRQLVKSANQQLLLLYLRIGEKLSKQIQSEKWGSSVLETLSTDLQKQLPGLAGFSARSLRKMRQFYESYQSIAIWPLATAKIERPLSKRAALSNTGDIEGFMDISFSHHLLILSRCKALEHRRFYIQQSALQNWSVTMLDHQIAARLVHTQGTLPNNFKQTMAMPLTTPALMAFKDEYLMDYLSLNSENERAIESAIVTNIRTFLLGMGKGFSFVGNQYRLEVEGEEFFVDLLFYNRNLQCLVAFELKRGKFKPEYAGQLNFYLNVLDSYTKLPHENPSIGIILCREKNNTVVEYSIKNVGSAMGVATFKTTEKMPKAIQEILPRPEDFGKLLTDEGLF